MLRAATIGAVSGTVGWSLFLFLHADVIGPVSIGDAWGGLLYAVASGAFLSLSYRQVRDDVIFTGPLRGATFGFIVGLMVVPILAAGTLTGTNFLKLDFPRFVAVFTAVGTIGFTSAILAFSGGRDQVTPQVLFRSFVFGLAGLSVSVFAARIASVETTNATPIYEYAVGMILLFLVCGAIVEHLMQSLGTRRSNTSPTLLQ